MDREDAQRRVGSAQSVKVAGISIEGVETMQIRTHCRWLVTLVAVAACACVSADDIEVTGPITLGSQGAPFSAPTVDVAARGYIVEEYFLTGRASAYRNVDGAEQTADGRWSTEREPTAEPFKTRILVVRPAANRDFNGTVIVHWQNVTAGYELGSVTDSEYLRGYAWVGVSAQAVGVNGFPGPDAAGLMQWDAERYGTLNHPGDAYSYDIFSQAGAVVGTDRPARDNDPMGGLNVRHLVAAGASQSASRLRTYINGVHSHAQVFDGYIPYIDFASTIDFAADKGGQRRGRRATRVRDDLGVPVFVVNSETETQAYVGGRQPNTDQFRFWEVAGTSHVSMPRATAASAPGLDSPNWLSYTPVYDAALRHMHVWLTEGTLPPTMPLIETETGATIKRDERGNAIGGIRLPDISVPTAAHNGFGTPVEGGSRFAFLYGTARDFSDGELAELYPTRSAYLAKYDAALAQAIDAGYVLAEDGPRLKETAAAWAARLPEE